MLNHLVPFETEEICQRQPWLAWNERQVGVRYYYLALSYNSLYLQMHPGELAPHRVNEPDECLHSICDLRIVLDEHPADMLRDGRCRFAEVERHV